MGVMVYSLFFSSAGFISSTVGALQRLLAGSFGSPSSDLRLWALGGFSPSVKQQQLLKGNRGDP